LVLAYRWKRPCVVVVVNDGEVVLVNTDVSSSLLHIALSNSPRVRGRRVVTS
jgi:hypothetical protein